MLNPATIRMSLNGETRDGALGPPTPFTFYDERALTIRHVHPPGGPSTGGTLLHIYIRDERILMDMGGEEVHGILCRFGRDVIVRGNLTDCHHDFRCGGGRGAIECIAPPYRALAGTTEQVSLAVSINGQDFSTVDEEYPMAATFEYYSPTIWMLEGIFPPGGGLEGGIDVVLKTVDGARLHTLGEQMAACRFGLLNPLVSATVQAGGEFVRCRAPPHWNRASASDANPLHVQLELTLNGQDYLSIAAPQLATFTYYKHRSPIEPTSAA